ncbi:hypothetical protein [Pasteurella multocida]|uniref:hypothetical protein n=1 Tax=Pasteurella multocida TaxID=747 RepID=UPI00230027B0|nr:hypothetical protein [Pasteurella multocida]MDA5608826.1 hypothetical protein [Pasteurella multocida subsp. multocida]MDA5616347.1 hypothetical protein [Pasteurella multocida]MDA5626366.1 hypothetical protein [Pasteurella multocida]
MTTYYFSETNHINAFSKGEALKATSLSEAKREASRKQCFQGTILKIGASLNEDGLLIDEIAVKTNKWQDK